MNQASFEEKMKRVEWLAEQARWAEMTLPKRGQCIVDEASAIMDAEYFKALGEYSTSLPTGTYIGKRWKKNNSVCPEFECSNCKKKFRGWASSGQPCPNAAQCEGTLSRLTQPDDWWMGEYFDIGSEKEVGIRWRKILQI